MVRVSGTYTQGVGFGVRQSSAEIRISGHALASATATEESLIRLYIDSNNLDKISFVEVYPSANGKGATKVLQIYGIA